MVNAAAAALVLIFVVILSPAIVLWNKRRNITSNCTVIVGGGSLGLCTAYFLAKEDNRRVIVVDALDEPFSAASSLNSGCLLFSEYGEGLVELGEYSQKLWKEFGRDPEFRRITGYRARALLDVIPGKGKGQDLLPNWVDVGPEVDVRTNPVDGDSASINPVAFGQWLVSRCKDLGVEIIKQTSIESAELSSHGTLKSVHCRIRNQHLVQIKCKNLVIAAGPWTPSVVKKLFPGSSINLKPTADASDWILLRNPYPMRLTSIAGIFFDGIMDGRLQIVGRNDSTIWVCDSTDKSAVLPAVVGAAKPNARVVEDMLVRAKSFVNGEVEVLNVGRAFRPVNESGLPVMARIPDAMLSKDAIYQDPERQGADGVFICWGHGRRGITLGMGSGKLMSQIMKGGGTDIDVSKFGVLQ
ncbi:hypothetical protein ACMFMG_008476 [Clarireedia jacksonii]